MQYWITNAMALVAAAGLLLTAGCGGSAPELAGQTADSVLTGTVLREASGVPRGVRLTWPRIDDPLVSGYRVYRSDQPIPDSARGDSSYWRTINSSQLVGQPGPATTIIQADDLFAAAIGETWYYRLSSVDGGSSESQLSGELVVTISEFEITDVTPLSTGVNSDVTVSGLFFGSYDEAQDNVHFTGVNWVTGVGFEPAMIEAPIVSWTPSAIVSRVPLGATSGPVDVTVGGTTKSSTQVFTNSHPYITDISVLAGVAGDAVVLTGNNFGNGFDGGHRVVVGSTLLLSANDYTSYTNTEIAFIIPQGPLGSQSVKVRVGSVDSNSAWLDLAQPAGPVWEHTWGEAGSEAANAVASDSIGDVYLAGYSNSYHSTFFDVLLVKYSSSGGFRWARVWDNTDRARVSERVELAEDLCLDDGNGIYLTGTVVDDQATPSVLLVKFNTDGEFQYARNWTVTNVANIMGRAISTDGTYLYIAALLKQFDAGQLVLLKYGLDGSLVSNYSWLVDREIIPNDIIIDGNGDVIVTGTAADVFAGGIDAFVLKTDSDFTPAWCKYWGTSKGADIAYGLYADSANNVMMVGGSDNWSALSAPILVVLRPDGSVITDFYWPTSNFAAFRSISEAASGNFYCVGSGWPAANIIYFAMLGDAASDYPVQAFRAYTHALTMPFGLGGWMTGGDDILICGQALQRGGVWGDLSVISTFASGDLQDETALLDIYDGTSISLSGTTTNVTGIENTGGGGEDALIIKYNPE